MMIKIKLGICLLLAIQMSTWAFRVVGYSPNYSTHPEAVKWTKGNYANVPPQHVLEQLTDVMFFSMALKGHYVKTAAEKAKGGAGQLDEDNFGYYKSK